MYTERTTERLQQGLERFTHSNAGRFITNERREEVTDPETGETRTEYVYDVYEVTDARSPRKAKDEVIQSVHPDGDELKVLRKTLARLLADTKRLEREEYAAFRAYHALCQSIEL